MERRSQTLRLIKTADQILDTLAAYCTRINDSRHWGITYSSQRVTGWTTWAWCIQLEGRVPIIEQA
jgi:hypothetical protein